MRVVQKYGGSSVAAVRLMRGVAARIAKELDQQDQELVVVVSAMGDETDNLAELAGRIGKHPRPRELDLLLATGEQKAVALMALSLQGRGVDAVALTGAQAGITTDTLHGAARLRAVDVTRLNRELAAGRVVVVAGFQGTTTGGEVTTLGRGGSDLTAVALAAALRADLCEIFTDVEGIYEADPAIVPAAAKIDRVSYDEMLELASNGSKVMQARSIEYAQKHGVRIEVRAAHGLTRGTLICGEDELMEQPVYRGTTVETAEAMLSVRGVPDRPGAAAELFGLLAARGIVVDMITQSASRHGVNDITCTIRGADVTQARAILDDLVQEVGGAGATINEGIAKVSIVGIGMRSARGVAATMFRALGDAGINIHLIATSEIRVSCVIDEDLAETAVRAVHRAFEVSPDVATEE